MSDAKVFFFFFFFLKKKRSSISLSKKTRLWEAINLKPNDCDWLTGQLNKTINDYSEEKDGDGEWGIGDGGGTGHLTPRYLVVDA